MAVENGVAYVVAQVERAHKQAVNSWNFGDLFDLEP